MHGSSEAFARARGRFVRLVLTAGLLLGLAPAAAAQVQPDPGPQWDDSYYPFARQGAYVSIGGFFGLENFDREAAIENPQGPVDISGDDAGVLDLRAGYRFHDYFSGEFLFRFYSGFEVKEQNTGADDKFDGWSMSLNAKAYGMLGAIQPYALFGAGGLVFTEKAGNDDAGFIARLGGGIDLYLTDHLVVEAEASYTLPAGDIEDFQFATFGGSIQYRF